LSASSIYRLVSEGRFPKPVKLAAAASAWVDQEIDAWLAARVAERDKAAQAEEAATNSGE
jgi:prophage regulatory protein